METLQQYYDRYRSALDQNTLDTFFSGTGFDDEDMVRLINCLDLFDEITRTPFFKSARYLETPDTYRRPDVHRIFNLKRVNGVSPNKIKKVGHPTNELIEELFSTNYLGLIYRLMYQVKRNQLEFKVGLCRCAVRIEPAVPHQHYGCLEFANFDKKIYLRLPFFLSRLGMEQKTVRTGS